MTASSSQEIDPWFACVQTINWLQAVADMAERSEEMHQISEALEAKLFEASLDPEARAQQHSKVFLYHGRSFSADHFFLEAARNAERWALTLLRVDLRVEEEINDFRETADVVTAIRNMREHADEYLDPNVKHRRKDFVQDIELENSLLGKFDATSSIRVQGDVIYGGRISRESVRAASAKLQIFLQPRLDMYMHEDSGM